MRGAVPVLMLVGASRRTALGAQTLQAVIPSAEAYLVAELHSVINYPRWRLRRKRN